MWLKDKAGPKEEIGAAARNPKPSASRLPPPAPAAHPGKGRLTRKSGGESTFSPIGIYGDATLATWAKGHAVIEAMLAGIVADVERQRTEPLPASD